jgi:hypothetical protein
VNISDEAVALIRLSVNLNQETAAALGGQGGNARAATQAVSSAVRG